MSGLGFGVRQSKSHVSIGDVLVSLNMVGEKDKVPSATSHVQLPTSNFRLIAGMEVDAVIASEGCS
ncbi:MAG TPA: hypothetical protein VGM51_15505 [Armatimonadota bacterium]